MIKTHSQDPCQYQSVTLANGIQCLLVQDPNCRKSAVAACINAGHFDDPDDCPGLMHLLEHTLFLGCETFPQPNHLSDFLSIHGGQVNAHTSTESSTFYFEVNHDFLLSAFTQLIYMLNEPLFHQTRITQEIDVVDAEFAMKQRDDLRRLYQVHKETSNPHHPFSRFSVGNKAVFSQFSAVDLQQMLINLHSKLYAGRNMTFCIICPPAQTHQFDHFCELLSSIAKGKKNKRNLPDLYQPNQLAVQIEVRPLQNAKRLIATFALPNDDNWYRAKPLELLSHILGDEGEGSLLSYLKENGLATNLSAGGGIQGQNFKDFNINLQLTDKGLSCIDQIIECLFFQIKQIRQTGLTQALFEERKHLNQLVFLYQDKSKSIDQAVQLANHMHQYPPQDWLCAPFILDDFNPTLFDQLLSFFTPSRLRLKLIHPAAQEDQQAQWYHTPYSVAPISRQRLKRWSMPKNFPIRLASANPFVMTNHTLEQPEKDYELPKLIHHEDAFRFWFAQDNQFQTPRADTFVSFDCPFVMGGLGNHTLKRLWVATMQEQLNERYYQAGLAGLNLNLYAHQAGFTLHTSGFAEKQWVLVENTLKDLFSNQLNIQRFDQIRAKQIQATQNALLNKPINRLFTKLNILLQRSAWQAQDMAPILQNVTFDQLCFAGEQMISTAHIQIFKHGNVSSTQAFQQAESAKTLFQQNTLGCAMLSRDSVDLTVDDPRSLVISTNHPESAVVVYFQAPQQNFSNIAHTIFLEHMLSAEFFNIVRTEKQLGYIVGSGYFPVNNYPGLAFYVQSNQHNIEHLYQEIEATLAHLVSSIRKKSNDHWVALSKAVQQQLLERDLSLSMKSQRLWMSIANQDLQFNHQQRILAEVQQIDINSLSQFAQNMLQNDGVGKLVLACTDKQVNDFATDTTRIDNVMQFKQTARYTI